jgi:hypothetical protein
VTARVPVRFDEDGGGVLYHDALFGRLLVEADRRNEANRDQTRVAHIFMSLSCMVAGFSTFLPSISFSFSRTLDAAREDEDRICSMRLLVLLLLARLRLPSGDGERRSVSVM